MLCTLRRKPFLPKYIVWINKGAIIQLTVYKAIVGSGTVKKALAKLI